MDILKINERQYFLFIIKDIRDENVGSCIVEFKKLENEAIIVSPRKEEKFSIANPVRTWDPYTKTFLNEIRFKVSNWLVKVDIRSGLGGSVIIHRPSTWGLEIFNSLEEAELFYETI